MKMNTTGTRDPSMIRAIEPAEGTTTADTTSACLKYDHPYMPGVTAGDYISSSCTHGRSLCKTPLLSSANEIVHEDCGQPPVM